MNWKNWFFSLREIIFTYLFSYVIIIGACLVYLGLGYENLDGFIGGCCSYLLIFYDIIVTIYLYKRNRRLEKRIHSQEIFPLIYLGIALAVFLNMIIFKIWPPVEKDSISIIFLFLASGIIGPIYEEILFRYLLYNRLKNFYSTKRAIFMNSLLFGLIHLSFIKIIYALILGFFLNIIYENKKNILAPILVHAAANSIVLWLDGYNTYILCLSFIGILISLYLIFYKAKRTIH